MNLLLPAPSIAPSAVPTAAAAARSGAAPRWSAAPRRRLRLAVIAPAAALLLALLLVLGTAGCQVDEDQYSSEGTANDSGAVSIGTAPTGFPGTVGPVDSSYYKVTVTEGTSHVINISQLLDDADLIVYSDATFSALLCASVKSGTADDFCTATAPTGVSTLYIQVKSHSTTGTTYLLTVG